MKVVLCLMTALILSWAWSLLWAHIISSDGVEIGRERALTVGVIYGCTVIGFVSGGVSTILIFGLTK